MYNIKHLKTSLIYFLCRQYSKICNIVFPIKNNILFESFCGNSYSDNPRAISETLHKKYPQYNIYWFMGTNSDISIVPNYVQIIRNKFLYYITLAKSFCYVFNNPLSPNLIKKKKQFFIQTSHGDRGFKKVFYEAYDDPKMRPFPVMDELYTDLCLAGSDYGEHTYRAAYHYQGEIMKEGSPRNDKLINNSEENTNSIKRYLHLPENKKIVLYAPTFRDHLGNNKQNSINLDHILACLNKVNNNYICLLRSHPASKGIIANQCNNIIDVSKYPDMADLLCICDILITDYSSCSSDFILTGKPVILSAYDLEDYEKEDRKLTCKLSETGFIIAHDDSEMEMILETYTEKEYLESNKKVMQFYKIHETGKASEKTCDRINHEYLCNFK